MKLLNDFITLHLDLINLKFNKKKSQICLNKKCKTVASFNYKKYSIINIRKHIYCKLHKLDNMINIKDKMCVICNNIIPVYHYKNEKKALYCYSCKTIDMINIKSKMCIKCDNVQPCFNYKNEKKALYCGTCKTPDMINIKDKMCIKCNNSQPCFNYKNEKKPLYCSSCKTDNMIDIMNKKCISCNNTQPRFNYKNEKKPLYCVSCKTDDMADIINKKCIFENCYIRSTFNYKDETQTLYCRLHKLDNMIDIVHKRCKTELCDIQISNKYFKGYCLRCFIYNFPNSKLIRDYGTREAKVSDFIKETYPNLNITYNKAVEGGCSKNRPDIFIDCLTHSVIIEIDEHQHKSNSKSYTPECEIQRINNLFTDLADRPILFIRFNPDSYTDKKNILVKSCFEYTEDKGLPKANKTLQTRLKKLKEAIDKNLTKVPNEHIVTIKLYYDGF
jgi:hypothetical protein